MEVCCSVHLCNSRPHVTQADEGQITAALQLDSVMYLLRRWHPDLTQTNVTCVQVKWHSSLRRTHRWAPWASERRTWGTAWRRTGTLSYSEPSWLRSRCPDTTDQSERRSQCETRSSGESAPANDNALLQTAILHTNVTTLTACFI